MEEIIAFLKKKDKLNEIREEMKQKISQETNKMAREVMEKTLQKINLAILLSKSDVLTQILTSTNPQGKEKEITNALVEFSDGDFNLLYNSLKLSDDEGIKKILSRPIEKAMMIKSHFQKCLPILKEKDWATFWDTGYRIIHFFSPEAKIIVKYLKNYEKMLKRATPKTNPTSPSEVISTLTLNEIERIYKMKQVMRDIVKKLSTTFSFSKKGGENE